MIDIKYYDDFKILSDEEMDFVYKKIERKGLKEKRSGLLYFISDGKFIKIGKTSNLNIFERIKSLQTGNPRKLIMIAFQFLNEDEINKFGSLERYYHALFKIHRKKGEWFELSECELDRVLREHEKLELTINYCDCIFKSSQDHTALTVFRTELPYDVSIEFRTEGYVDGGHGRNMITFKFNNGCIGNVIPFCNCENEFCFDMKLQSKECLDCKRRFEEDIRYEGFHLLLDGQCEFQSLYACLVSLIEKMSEVEGLNEPNYKSPSTRWY